MRRIALFSLFFAVACGSDAAAPAGQDVSAFSSNASATKCVDADGDGYGASCQNGSDCDDRDDTVFEDCPACFAEREGCGCEEDALPVECKLSSAQIAAGATLCKTGVRYCRDGLWTACVGVASFE